VATSLRFGPSGAFTVAQFTDLHWQNGAPEDLRTSALVGAVLDAERPDLAVFSGDVIAGRPCRDPVASLRSALEPAIVRGLPWALVFGNHDDEGTAGRAELLAALLEWPGCLVQPGPPELPGAGHYRIVVRAARGRAPAATLYFLDSLGYAPPDVGGYAWFQAEQIRWFRALPRDPSVPALAFFHIPLPEYAEVWATRTCRGVRHEAVCCPRINSGMFLAMRDAGDVVAMSVGHDHVNDYEGELHGLRLCYGRATGFHTYGRDGMERGARLFRFREGWRGVETWLRLEGGEVVAQQPEHAPGDPDPA
jgi:hypothetical protein